MRERASMPILGALAFMLAPVPTPSVAEDVDVSKLVMPGAPGSARRDILPPPAFPVKPVYGPRNYPNDTPSDRNAKPRTIIDDVSSSADAPHGGIAGQTRRPHPPSVYGCSPSLGCP
jgi:hypothetical protein